MKKVHTVTALRNDECTLCEATFHTEEQARAHMERAERETGCNLYIRDRDVAPHIALDTTIVYGDHTLREFFKECLKRLVIEEEGFSGKRPMGNSGWLQEIREALDVEDDKPILEAIDAL